MTSTDVMKLRSPAGDLQQYIRFVRSVPEIDAEKERELAERFRRDDDLEAAWQLVTSHLRYVVNIARGYAGYGLPQEDLIQEGNIGLMKAVRRFDPARGVRLLAYAVYWIRAHIHDFILNNWRLVKVATTKARRRLFYRLRGAKKRLDWLSAKEAEEIAEDLNVSPEDVRDMEANLYRSDASFDLPADAESEDACAPAEFLADDQPQPESVAAESDFLDATCRALRRALTRLDERSREIIERRWLVGREEKATLQELGDRFGVSAERIRQLEQTAIARLRDSIETRLDVQRLPVCEPARLMPLQGQRQWPDL